MCRYLCLRLAVTAAHDEPECLRVVGHEFFEDAVSLHRQFARGRENDGAGAVAIHELELCDQFDNWDEESERFSASGARRRILYDPFNLWNIEPSSGDVCAKDDSGLSVAKLEVGRGAFRLFLLPMNRHARNVDIIEKLDE